MTGGHRVLLVEDDAEYRQAMEGALAGDFAVLSASTVVEATNRLDPEVDLVLLDVRLNASDEEDRRGLTLLQSIRQLRPDLPVVMMTAYGDIDLAVEAMKLGASDFVQKGRLDIREFRNVLHNALERSKLQRRVAELEEDLRRIEPWQLVGDHALVEEVRDLVEMVARDGHSTVMIRGETGTGKELVARAIHQRGWRKEGPFVGVSLPALSAGLVERELFGHVRGAFTDAREARAGYFERADGGVVFLDEIGELAPDVQPKLLRFLDTRMVVRVGSTDERKVDLQVVCATNRKLEDAMGRQQFRQDLYFRLRTVEISLPALRERREDIPLLVDHFLSLLREQGRTRVGGIAPSALDCLARYSFPGNVRELRSVVERAMLLAAARGHSLIDASDLPLEVQEGTRSLPIPRLRFEENGVNLDEELARVELGLIEDALRATEGKKTEAWRLLGLNDRFALRRRVKRLLESWPQLARDLELVSKRYKE